MKQIKKHIIKREEKFDKEIGGKNFRMLSHKLAVKPSGADEKDKNELHLLRKKHYNGLRGPGTYPIETKATSFNVVQKKEQL